MFYKPYISKTCFTLPVKELNPSCQTKTETKNSAMLHSMALSTFMLLDNRLDKQRHNNVHNLVNY